MKKILVTLLVVVMVACSSEPAVVATPATPDLLREHNKEFKKGVYPVVPGVWVAIGFGLANSILIEGTDGAIIVDTMESLEEGQAVRAAFEKVSDKPVKALIYTHNHTDHVFGSGAWADTNPRVYAHNTTLYYIQRIASKLRPIIGTRSMRMFGTYLPEGERINCGIGPFLGINENSTISLQKPTHTFTDQLTDTVAGIRFELVHAPGETDDQLFVWLPKHKVLLPGDNFYRSFPNLYTIRGTPYRKLHDWVASLDKMRALRPLALVPSHTRPVTGENEIYERLTNYRDAIQFVHDQTVRSINMGYTPDQAVDAVQLPPHLRSDPWLQETYGKVSWSVRSVFAGELGWFSGNAADLHPPHRFEKATVLAELAGGTDKLLPMVEKLQAEGKLQEALWLLDLAGTVRGVPGGKIRPLRIAILRELGAQEANPNARNWYFSEAMEYDKRIVLREKTNPLPETVALFPLKLFFEGLKVNLDANAARGKDTKVGFDFIDSQEKYTIWVRKGVAEVRPYLFAQAELDIHVRLEQQVFKEMLAQIRNPVTTLSSFDYPKGGLVAMGNFMKMFLPADQKLPAHTP